MQKWMSCYHCSLTRFTEWSRYSDNGWDCWRSKWLFHRLKTSPFIESYMYLTRRHYLCVMECTLSFDTICTTTGVSYNITPPQQRNRLGINWIVKRIYLVFWDCSEGTGRLQVFVQPGHCITASKALFVLSHLHPPALARHSVAESHHQLLPLHVCKGKDSWHKVLQSLQCSVLPSGSLWMLQCRKKQRRRRYTHCCLLRYCMSSPNPSQQSHPLSLEQSTMCSWNAPQPRPLRRSQSGVLLF